MANCTYDLAWREGMLMLLDQLEFEHPENQTHAPQDLADWSAVYIRYVQILRKLEMAYDQLVHPQKRMDLKRALEACMGRMLEVKLNRGLDFPALDDVLVDLKLTPDAIELAPPRYFLEDRCRELEDRRKFLDALSDKYTVAGIPEAGPLAELPPLPEDDAILAIQANERGRQARERARIMRTVKRQRQLEDRRARAGLALTQEDAAVRIQAGMRGHLSRKRTKADCDEELRFIGMRPKVLQQATDQQALEVKAMAKRKAVQAEHLREYEEAVVALKVKVREQEGQDMRETIQDKINAWFIENRKPDTGDYPDFPDEADGGSRLILNPAPIPPPPAAPPPDAKGKKPAPKPKPAPAKGKGKGKGKDEPVEEKKPEVVTSIFTPDVEASVQQFVERWQSRDEGGNALSQKHEPELVKAQMRPLVFEEIRQQVDAEMSVLLQNLKDMVEAERAAKSGKKAKGKKGKKGKKAKKAGKEKKGKKRKDLTADRSIESLYAELVSNGILQPVPARPIAAFLGTGNFLGATLERAGVVPDPSPANVRQALTEYCLLPLGSQYVHDKMPCVKALLLYGVPKSGKTSICQAVAHCVGANFLDLSPRNTDGKYPGKTVAMMIHMAFKVARAMEPSVIYIDEVEKVFVSDKKRMKEFGGTEPLSRIKKELLKEMKALEPQARILVLGTSAEPQLCTKKDEKAFINFFDRHIYMPMPDYASRLSLWPGLVQRHGGRLEEGFDLSTLAHISEGYSSGTIDQVVRSLLTQRRLQRMAAVRISMPEVLQWLCRAEATNKDAEAAIRKWTDKTPARAALLKPPEESKEKDKKAGPKKKK